MYAITEAKFRFLRVPYYGISSFIQSINDLRLGKWTRMGKAFRNMER